MSSEFEEEVADTIDDHLTPTQKQSFSRHSSGGVSDSFCSTGGLSTHKQTAGAQSSELCCPICSKVYKQLKGYQKHIFLHQVSDYNQRKPDMELIIATSEEFCTGIFTEMRRDFDTCQEKTAIVDAVLQSVGSCEWLVFLQTFSEPIIEALSSRTTLLPSNQYEEFLVSYNKFLNNREEFSKLKTCFENLVPERHRNPGKVTFILLRLCIRFPEEVQLFISKEMSKNTVSCFSWPVDEEFNEEAFSSDMSNILRHYFIKGCNLLNNEVWRLRCRCIQSHFVSFTDDECDIKLKSNWTSGSVVPSVNFLSFCKGVEGIIKSKLKLKCLKTDDLVIELLDPAYADICNCWHSLTLEYFSEMDCLVFMRDFVLILCKRSLKSEETLIRGQVEESQKLKKVAIRENLHRN